MICNKCKIDKPAASFPRRDRSGSLRKRCRDCENSRIKAWASERPQRSKIAAPLTIERLRAVLHYDPLSGIFTWLQAAGKNTGLIGQQAGCDRGDGYIVIGIDNKMYLAHRLAWFHVHGVWPSDQLDHRDLDHSNNRIANLREANNSQNCANVGSKNPASGLKGVAATRNGRRFTARLHHNGKNEYLGTHDTKEIAHEAYMQRAAEVFGDFARSSE